MQMSQLLNWWNRKTQFVQRTAPCFLVVLILWGVAVWVGVTYQNEQLTGFGSFIAFLTLIALGMVLADDWGTVVVRGQQKPPVA